MMAYSKSQSRMFRGVLVAAVAFWFSPPVNAADVYNGKTVYNSYCQGCHGTNGRGEMPGTPNFSRGGALMKPDISLFRHISEGKNAMPGFRGVLSEREILDVITYIRTLF